MTRATTEARDRERRSASRASRRAGEMISRSSLYALLMDAPALICILRGETHIFELVNPLYARLFQNRDLLGKPIREALPELDGQPYFDLLDLVYDTGTTHFGHESRASIDRRGDGTLEDAFFNFTYQAMRDGNGVIDGVVVFAFEVTDLVESRRRVEALAEELRKSNREKDDFTAAISHELRTPLTSILGWTRMMKMGGLDESTFRVALDSIERSAKSQVQLIEDLLDESRITSGKLVLHRRALRVSDVIEAAIALMAPVAEAKGVHLESDVGSEPLIISGDPTRLQQVAANLLSNAIKFTSEGGRVVMTCSRRGGFARIIVADTGRGIRSEFLPHIFDRFRQDENTSSERQGGLGLGLSIGHHLVEMHGGTISAASDGVGMGATFTVELPLFRPSGALSPFLEREDDDRYSALPSLTGVKVLIVEDEPDNRDLIAAVMLRCGANVEVSATGDDAEEKVQRWLPDVIVCDIMLPREDGCALLERLRALPPERGGETPALALSVHGRVDERDRAHAAGFAIYRQKPIEPADLAHDIARLAARDRDDA